MSLTTDLEPIERSFWLKGADAFRARMREDAVMVFPPPAGILTGKAVLDGLDGAPRWDAVEMSAVELRVASETAILAYRAEARRGEEAPYRAFCLSVYIRQGGEWRLAAHQQTPSD